MKKYIASEAVEQGASARRPLANPSMMCCRVGWALALLWTAAVTGRGAEKVTFQQDWFAGPQFAGIYIAADQGFYSAAGLDVEIAPFHLGVKPREAIAAAPNASLGCIEGYIFLQERAAAQPLVALAANFQESPAGYMFLDPVRIAGPADLAGKRVGVHRFADALYRWFLRRGHVAPEASTMSFVDNDIAHLVHGEVDAMQGYAIDEYVALRQQEGARAHFISFRALGFDAYSEVFFTTADQLATHRAALLAFLEATRRGWVFAFAHSDAALTALEKRMGSGFDPDKARSALHAEELFVHAPLERPLAPMQPEKWEAMERAAVEMGLLPSVEAPARFLDAGVNARAPR